MNFKRRGVLEHKDFEKPGIKCSIIKDSLRTREVDVLLVFGIGTSLQRKNSYFPESQIMWTPAYVDVTTRLSRLSLRGQQVSGVLSRVNSRMILRINREKTLTPRRIQEDAELEVPVNGDLLLSWCVWFFDRL